MQPNLSKITHEKHLYCKRTTSNFQNLCSICSHWKPVTSLKNCDCCTRSARLVLWAISRAVFKTNPVFRTSLFLKIKAIKVSCGHFPNLVRKRSNLSWPMNLIDSTQTGQPSLIVTISQGTPLEKAHISTHEGAKKYPQTIRVEFRLRQKWDFNKKEWVTLLSQIRANHRNWISSKEAILWTKLSPIWGKKVI